MRFIFDPAMSHWELILKRGMSSFMWPAVCMLEHMCGVITTSLKVTKVWNQPNYPLIGE